MAAPADTLPASLVFLTDAAHLLAATSPETSAHLMAQRNNLLTSAGLVLPDAQRQHACTACGHIMVPGRADVLRLDAHKAALRRRTKPRLVSSSSKKAPRPSATAGRPSLGGRKRLECAMCTSYTDIGIAPPPKMTRRRPGTASTTIAKAAALQAATTAPRTSSTPAAVAPATSSASVVEPPKSSTNASSKKRAKSRKQGLQALLQQSRSSTPQSGLGLSLADFMKK